MKLLTELLIHQTKDANNWTNKLVNEIDPDKWFETPGVLESNIAWQLGHLTLSQYYYTVVLLTGPDKELAENISLKKYSGLFANGTRKNDIAAELSVDELKYNWKLMEEATVLVLDALNDPALIEGIIKMPKPHPFVKTKQDSVLWNIKHTMWHCGQIGTLKRVIDKPYEFGL